jgi:hypothetical protein
MDAIDYSKIQFSPAVPMPVPFDVKERIQQLRNFLDPNHPHYQLVPEYQHVNIKAIIKLYEEGKIDGTQKVYLKDGKIVPREEAFKGPSAPACEGMFYQLAQKHSYGNGPFGVGFHEVSICFPIIFFLLKKRGE